MTPLDLLRVGREYLDRGHLLAAADAAEDAAHLLAARLGTADLLEAAAAVRALGGRPGGLLASAWLGDAMAAARWRLEAAEVDA